MQMIRLQKYLADAGVASRRKSEALIQEGRIAIDGEVVRLLGVKIEPGVNEITLDGRPVRVGKRLYLALNKPRKVLSSVKSQDGKPTVLELMPRHMERLYPVGRLDYDSEGLLFLTNDGEFSLRVTHPRYRVQKHYEVVIEGKANKLTETALTKGVRSRGDLLRADSAVLTGANRSRSYFKLVLSEGKNREIRRMFKELGHRVESLVRVQIGSVKIGELPLGRYRRLTAPEIQSFGRG